MPTFSYADVASGRRLLHSCESQCNQTALPSTSSEDSVKDRWKAAVATMERERLIQEKVGLLINGRYRVLSKISFGTYGMIYSANDKCTGKNVAVKFVTGGQRATNSQLQREYNVYSALKGVIGIPEVYWYGIEFNYQLLVMQLLGPSLAQLYNYCDRWFTVETIKKIGEQMLLRLRSLHSRGYVHRDLKPENFLMGIDEDEETCYLIDFGLARCYRSSDETQGHVALQRGSNLVGTGKYASVRSHKGITLSRRDDLESLGYILIEFINRSLPWSAKDNQRKNGKHIRSKEQSYNRIRIMKERTNWTLLCPPMAPWINYCTQLGFADTPNYDYLNGVLQSITVLSDDDRCSLERRSSFGESGPDSSFLTEQHHYSFTSSTFGSQAKKYISGNFDDGTKRYSWIMRRESCTEEKQKFKCLYRWTNNCDARNDSA